MTVLEYITKDINLTKEQFEAITQLARLCEMRPMFETVEVNDDFDDDFDDDGILAGDSDGEVIKKANDKKLEDKAKSEEKEEAKLAANPVVTDDDEFDREMVPFDIAMRNEGGMINYGGGFNTEDAMGGYDESDSTYDIDAINEKHDEYEEEEGVESVPETPLQKDSREIIERICQAINASPDDTALRSDQASAATNQYSENKEIMLEKLTTFVTAFTADQLQLVATDCLNPIMSYITRYTPTNGKPGSPLNDALTTLLSNVTDQVLNGSSTDIKGNSTVAGAASATVSSELKDLFTPSSGKAGPASAHSVKNRFKDRAAEMRKKKADMVAEWDRNVRILNDQVNDGSITAKEAQLRLEELKKSMPNIMQFTDTSELGGRSVGFVNQAEEDREAEADILAAQSEM